MAQPKLVLTKDKESKLTKPVFIDVDLLEGIKALKHETGLSIQKIAEKFIKYGLENVEIEEGD